ncbi:MAG: thiamine pyrophosphate-binding protein, partial [Bacteroidia bacterium]|nr:thiamine pyrophosphate-binding protein [Bacteroidia bacterium]
NLPENSALHLANSYSVYLAQLFTIPASVHVFCNRGTNGIEGSLSTAVGYAAVSGRLTFLLTGDLSFFYDMNGLWNKHITPNLRILVNNNGGGGIFHSLPGLNASEALNEYIAAAHATDARTWAEQQGFLCLTAHNAKELQQHLPLFVNHKSLRPVLLEVFTSMEVNREQTTSYYQQQKNNRK